MALTDDEEKALRQQLKAAEELLAAAKKEAKTPDEKGEVAEMKRKLEEMEEALKAGQGKPGEIKGVSENSVHAVLETCKAILARVEDKKPAEAGIRLVPW